MRVIGIDPGYAIVGVGVTEFKNNAFKVLDYGAVTTDAGMTFDLRLAAIYREITEQIEIYKPDAMAIEKLFFNTNTTTAIGVAEARGCIRLAAANLNVPVFEYTPLQVKQAVTGYGQADKQQVMEMTRRILNLKKIPSPDDVADALAIAVCHCHTQGSMLSGL